MPSRPPSPEPATPSTIPATRVDPSVRTSRIRALSRSLTRVAPSANATDHGASRPATMVSNSAPGDGVGSPVMALPAGGSDGPVAPEVASFAGDDEEMDGEVVRGAASSVPGLQEVMNTAALRVAAMMAD